MPKKKPEPKTEPPTMIEFMAEREVKTGSKFTRADLASYVGVTPAVITRAFKSGNDFRVEAINSKRGKLWEFLGSPWRLAKSRDTMPNKYRK